jgi:Domain of unknown function (DUF4249)
MLLKYRFIWFVFFLQSCKEVKLHITLPYEGKKLVVYANLSPDNAISLYLSGTFPPTGNIKIPPGLAGAQVSLFENDIFKSKLVYADSGNYVSPIKPQVGSSYRFEISLDGYPAVSSASVEIPTKVNSASFYLGNVIGSVPGPGEIRKFDVEWTDKDSRPNDYIVKIQGLYKSQLAAIYVDQAGKESEIQDGCSFMTIESGYIFRDICFPLQTFKTSFGVAESGQIIEKTVKIDSYKVDIANISASYFEYLQNAEEPFGVYRAFTIPKTRYTNIKNGYGVVVASNTTSFFVNNK